MRYSDSFEARRRRRALKQGVVAVEIVVFLFVLFYLVHAVGSAVGDSLLECDNKGGVWVRSLTGQYKCAKVIEEGQ
jgi:hypothetical protein